MRKFRRSRQVKPRVRSGRLDIGAFEADFEAALLGDVNLDGTVDFLDISPFILRLATGTFQVEAYLYKQTPPVINRA